MGVDRKSVAVWILGTLLLAACRSGGHESSDLDERLASIALADAAADHNGNADLLVHVDDQIAEWNAFVAERRRENPDFLRHWERACLVSDYWVVSVLPGSTRARAGEHWHRFVFVSRTDYRVLTMYEANGSKVYTPLGAGSGSP